MITSHRQQKLEETWGFTCSCAACVAADHINLASDQRIRQIRALTSELKHGQVHANPDMAELLVSLYTQERLSLVIGEPYRLAAIEWNGIGRTWKAVRYARLAIEAGLNSFGPMHNSVLDMEQLVLNPLEHWSWMKRSTAKEDSE